MRREQDLSIVPSKMAGTVVGRSGYDPTVYHDRYSPVRMLWLRVIVRAAWDFAMYKDSTRMKEQKLALDASRWLFDPSSLVNGLENICRTLGVSVEAARRFAREMTKDKVKKMDLCERQGRDPVLALIEEDGDG